MTQHAREQLLARLAGLQSVKVDDLHRLIEIVIEFMSQTNTELDQLHELVAQLNDRLCLLEPSKPPEGIR